MRHKGSSYFEEGMAILCWPFCRSLRGASSWCMAVSEGNGFLKVEGKGGEYEAGRPHVVDG